MRSLYKFIQLTPARKALHLKAVLLVALVRLGLWVLPFRMLKWIINRIGSHPLPHHGVQMSPDEIAAIVGAAARRIPHATCLTQAMSLHLLCRRRGYETFVRIGVGRDGESKFRAHAWVEREGKVIIGNLADLNTFLPLPSVGL